MATTKTKGLSEQFDAVADYVIEPNILRELAGRFFDVAMQGRLFEEVQEALAEFSEDWNIPASKT